MEAEKKKYADWKKEKRLFKLYASASKYNLVFISYGRIESNKCVTNGEKRIKSEKKTRIEQNESNTTAGDVLCCGANCTHHHWLHFIQATIVSSSLLIKWALYISESAC